MTTKERIEKDAVDFSEAPYYEGGGKLSCSPRLYLKRGYIAGATAEAERIKKELEQRDRKMIGNAWDAAKYGNNGKPLHQHITKQQYISSIIKP